MKYIYYILILIDKMSFLYSILRYGAKTISKVYFKKVYVVGEENIPKVS